MSSNSMWWILNSIFIVVFDVVFFLLVEPISDIQWLSFTFLHLSYILVILFSNFLRNRQTDVVLGYPVIYLSLLYFGATFLLSLAVIIFEFASFKMTFVLHFVLLGIYLFVLFSNLLMNKQTVQEMATERKNISFVKENVARLEQIKMGPLASTKKKEIDRIIEKLRYGQITSNNDTVDLEHMIRLQIIDLTNASSDEDLAMKLQQIEDLLKRREITIKSMVTN